MDGFKCATIALTFLLITLLGRPDVIEAINCYTCASPLLAHQWQATGFPSETLQHMKNFQEDCGTREDLPSEECPTSSCVEMILIVGGRPAVVRGCHKTLMNGKHTEVAFDRELCYFGQTKKMVRFLGEDLTGAYESIRFCSMSDNCNNVLKIKKETISGIAYTSMSNCKQQQTTDCHLCYRFDEDGRCYNDITDTCQGAWCTKTIGYLDGRYIEIRGCAMVNPYNTPKCLRVEMEHIMGVPAEMSLSQTYTTDQCFCQGSKCNGAAAMAASLAGVAFLFTVAIFLS